MLINQHSICSVVRSVDFRNHHIKYTKLNGEKVLNKPNDLINAIVSEKTWFYNQNGFRTLVLSKQSLENLKNYVVPKEIRVDVLKTLPNRKDIIQIDEQNCIQYVKTDTKLYLSSYFRKTIQTKEYFDRDTAIHTHFMCVDLVNGKITFDQNNTFTDEVFYDVKDVVEKYYSKFMVIVTYLELTEIKLEIVNSILSKKRNTNPNLKNSSRFDVIRVTSKWNTVTINLNPIDVRGHWRLQPYGTGRSMYKYIWIEPFKKNLTVRQPQKMLV